MTKVNKKFIKGMQSELDRKAPEYDGKDNPKNYKNMSIRDLWNLINADNADISMYIKHTDKGIIIVRDEVMKKLIAISNRCWMIWDKLNKLKGDR